MDIEKGGMIEVLGSHSQTELTVPVTVTAIVSTHALRPSPGDSEPFEAQPTSRRHEASYAKLLRN